MHQLPASYRDSNNGYVFEHEEKIFRLVKPRYYEHYNALIGSGLYEELIAAKRLVQHNEVSSNEFNFPVPDGKIIQPAQIPFISWPYEWSFDMWKDAALLTLKIAATSLKKGMIIKDATPFNVQFLHGSPIFIDTLSFEKYEEGKSWVAYRQFCECFLAPLLLMNHCHKDANKLFTVFPEGIPLDMLVTLLPGKARWNLDIFLHIFLQKKLANGSKEGSKQTDNLPKKKLEILFKGLLQLVNKLSLKQSRSAWDDYYSNTIFGNEYLNAKTALVQSFLQDIYFETLIDLGANEGHFSLLFKDRTSQIISIDADAKSINDLYLETKNKKINNILPLIVNLTSPSPSIGWNNMERSSLTERLKGDVVLALALVHHLAIANNLPLPFIADWLVTLGNYLVIEFVPKSDEKVKLLLQNRKDIFDDYSIKNFKEIFSKGYEILHEQNVGDTDRLLFLMKKK